MPKPPAAAVADRVIEGGTGEGVELQQVDVELGESNKKVSSCGGSIPAKPLLPAVSDCGAAAAKSEGGDEEDEELITRAKSQLTSREAELEVNMFAHLAGTAYLIYYYHCAEWTYWFIVCVALFVLHGGRGAAKAGADGGRRHQRLGGARCCGCGCGNGRRYV